MLSVEGEIMAASINPVTCVIVLVLSDHTITIIDPLFEVIVEGIDLKVIYISLANALERHNVITD